jgi:hypothetical protein
MRKFIAAALVAAAALTAASAANAGFFDPWGIYHPTCTYTLYYGPICG